MTLSGVIALILRYFTEFDSFQGALEIFPACMYILTVIFECVLCVLCFYSLVRGTLVTFRLIYGALILT